MVSDRFSRREVLQTGGAVAVGAAVLGLPEPPSAQADPGAVTGARRTVTLREGTNIACSVSPDGRWVAMDLVTGIWVLPIAGGRARRLTDDLQDATLPRWSPDSRQLVFQSYRDGNFHLWTIPADGSAAPRQLTSGPFDHREPVFSPDGAMLAFSSDRGGTGSYGVFTYDLASATITAVTDSGAEEAAPCWFPDGRRIAYTVDEAVIDSTDRLSGATTRLITAPQGTRLFGPSVAPDGATLSHLRLRGASTELMVGDTAITHDEDVFAFPASWLSAGEVAYAADGQLWRRRLGGARVGIPFHAEVSVAVRGPARRFGSSRGGPAKGIASPVCSPDGRRIAFRALNALWLAEIGGRPQRIVSDGFFNSDPDFSPDGRSLVYSSDRAGDADLWLRDLGSGTERRLTALPGAQLTPRWSPDGAQIAYTDHDGATWILQLASGAVRQITPPLFMPGRPTWSPDSKVVALAAVKPYSMRFREGTSQVLKVDLATGALTYTEAMPHRSIATRGDDGPVWSPDGRHLAFVVESVAWVVRVDPAGNFLGTPVQVTREATDSLAWQDNNRLLYLNNGQLKSTAIGGGQPVRVPLVLPRPAVRVGERRIIHAGALWDGTSPRLRRDVDIVLDHGRVVAVQPHTPGLADVDAGELTAMPGLVDAHVHWHLRGRQWGDRQGRIWLSYGITTVRSPGDPAYQMVETRESLESGARIGPRYFATGEAIDGSRVFYNFMRTTRGFDQLRLEMDRAKGLGYDLIKTYVRLPVAAQQKLVEAAHQAGMKLSSHYLYPAAAFGMDGMEHTGATNRLGYSHTVSRLGRAYSDVIALFTASGMSLTPTLFNSSVLYAEDRSLVEDRRTRLLYPAWEYQRLLEKAAAASAPAAAATRELLRANVEMVLRLHRAGGLVIAGTDAPLDNTAISLHTNLRAMVEYGFTPFEALTTATRNPARWLGREDQLGVIAPGANADLVLVQGDPLTDIRAAAEVRQVMVAGILSSVEDLVAPFRTPQSAPASVTSAPAPQHDHRHWWHQPEWALPICCGEH